jgi:outer membrane protein TolC
MYRFIYQTAKEYAMNVRREKRSGKICLPLVLAMVLTAWLAVPGGEVAAETISLTLDEAIALGLENSTTLKSKTIAVEASRAGLRAARSSFYPIFSAGANWTHNFSQAQSPSVSFFIPSLGELAAPAAFVFAQDPVTVNFDVQQPIYTFGRIKGGVGLAQEGLNLAKLDLTEEQRSLIVDIKRAFYNYILTKELVAVQEETLAQREDTYRVALERYEAGLVPDFEVLSAESDVANFKTEVIAALNQVELSLLVVKDLLNVQETEGYDLELIGELVPVYFDFDRKALIGQAMENNFELKQTRASINFAQYEESLKKAERRPLIGSFANYRVNSTFDTSTGANDFTNWNDLFSVGVNVSIPLSALLPYSQEYAEKVQSSLDVAELRSNLSSKENTIRIGIDGILLTIREQEAQIKSSEKTEELASRLYESAAEQFANGLITRLELKDAEIRLNSARIGYLTAVFNYIQALYDLLNAVGLYEFDES